MLEKYLIPFLVLVMLAGAGAAWVVYQSDQERAEAQRYAKTFQGKWLGRVAATGEAQRALALALGPYDPKTKDSDVRQFMMPTKHPDSQRIQDLLKAAQERGLDYVEIEFEFVDEPVGDFDDYSSYVRLVE